MRDRPEHAHRFYVPGPLRAGSMFSLPPARARHAVRVLRLRLGDPVVLFDGTGIEVPGRIVAVDAGAVTVRLGQPCDGRAEPPLAITLAQSLLKADRFDWVVQKATELGVSRIVPLVTARTVVSLADGHATGRVARWRRIAVEAAEQSGRVSVPDVAEPETLADLLDDVGRQPAIVLWEGETRTSLAEAMPADADRLLLVVGPEGGFSDDEVGDLAAAGARSASLGSLILRSETAAVAGVAVTLAFHAAHRAARHPPQ